MTDDATRAEATAGEVVRYAAAPAEEYRPAIMLAPEEAKALDGALRANMKAILREGVDYGVIPGTGSKPSLLKPGAEKLLQWFGLGHKMHREDERDPDGAWIGVTYKCIVTKAMQDGREVTVAECEGYAGYEEDRFYLCAEAAEAKERANAKRYNREANPSKFAAYKAPRNSVMKMSEKRAMVGAALQATSASSLFTQDMEDMTDPVQSVGDVADGLLRALPPEAGAELDRWYTALNWPPPGKWSTEQWCRALLAAGKISAGASGAPAPAATAAAQPKSEHLAATPADDPWYDPASQPQAKDDARQRWLSWATESAVTFTTPEAAARLSGKISAKLAAGQVTADGAGRLTALIDARTEELEGEPVEGVIVTEPLAPEDAWAAKVQDITSQDDADAAMADLKVSAKASNMPMATYQSILAAIQARAAELQKAAA
jgi:hypothetical protein